MGWSCQILFINSPYFPPVDVIVFSQNSLSLIHLFVYEKAVKLQNVTSQKCHLTLHQCEKCD